jgi:chromosome segregation ATPase
VRQEREDSNQVETLKQELEQEINELKQSLKEVLELKQEIDGLKEHCKSTKIDETILKLAIPSVVQHLAECEECRKKIGLVVEENDGEGELGEGNEGRKVGIFYYPES